MHELGASGLLQTFSGRFVPAFGCCSLSLGGSGLLPNASPRAAAPSSGAQQAAGEAVGHLLLPCTVANIARVSGRWDCERQIGGTTLSASSCTNSFRRRYRLSLLNIVILSGALMQARLSVSENLVAEDILVMERLAWAGGSWNLDAVLPAAAKTASRFTCLSHLRETLALLAAPGTPLHPQGRNLNSSVLWWPRCLCAEVGGRGCGFTTTTVFWQGLTVNAVARYCPGRGNDTIGHPRRVEETGLLAFKGHAALANCARHSGRQIPRVYRAVGRRGRRIALELHFGAAFVQRRASVRAEQEPPAAAAFLAP